MKKSRKLGFLPEATEEEEVASEIAGDGVKDGLGGVAATETDTMGIDAGAAETASLTGTSAECTVVWNSQESRRKYWATRLSVRSFARTAHSLACSGLLTSLAPSAALTRSLARSLRSLPRSWDSE